MSLVGADVSELDRSGSDGILGSALYVRMDRVNWFNSALEPMSALSTFGWARDPVPSLVTCAMARNDSCPIQAEALQ